MTIKQFIKNIKFKNLKFIIQAKFRKFIIKEYSKIFNEEKIDDMLFAVYSCPKCYENNVMECCGCNFKEAITTGKKCKNGKW
jgi:hypothetical protein